MKALDGKKDSAESPYSTVCLSNEMSNLYGILVMQNKLRVSYCNYCLLGEARKPASYWGMIPHLCEFELKTFCLEKLEVRF